MNHICRGRPLVHGKVQRFSVYGSCCFPVSLFIDFKERCQELFCFILRSRLYVSLTAFLPPCGFYPYGLLRCLPFHRGHLAEQP